MNPLPFINSPILDLVRQLPKDDIMWLEGDRNYTYIHFCNGRKMIFSKTLQLIEAQLPNDDFSRISKGATVNIGFIKTINLRQKHLQLSCGLTLPISRRRLPGVRKWWRGNQSR